MAATPADAPPPAARLPESIAGMTLSQLRDDYHRRLFQLYLPFWDKGGVDRQHGGFLCELNDDGTVHDDEKFLWYQARGIWVYSYLYNQIDRDPRWLEVARKARGFMVRSMYAGEGQWREKVHRDGTPLEGVGKTVYGWLFAAVGLAELYLADGRQEDLDLVKASLRAAVQAYDDPNYADTFIMMYVGLDLPVQGLRSQGHSMVVITALTRLLAQKPDPELEALLQRHVDLVVNKFWNPEYGIQNELLDHDYRRVDAAKEHMYTGHSVETLWMVMEVALRRHDRALFHLAAGRVRHLLEMTWDYVFDGFGSGNYHVFGDGRHPQGPDFSVKTMWAQCEAMLACMMVLEHTGETWALAWYERMRTFTLRTMPNPSHGVWRQAVDRQGKDIQRVGLSRYRKDNFHQARYLMRNLEALDRMIANRGKPTPR
jgi:N-acylglucosamine 2-epimerase